MDAYDQAIAYAAKRGAQDGANAAGWYLQDTLGGRVTGDPVKAARYILRGIEDGDSAVTDGFPFADLSGEWADTLTGPELVHDALWAVLPASDDPSQDDATEDAFYADVFTDVCDAYENAYNTAAQDAIAQYARDILATPEA